MTVLRKGDYILRVDADGYVVMTCISSDEKISCKDFDDLWACLTTRRTGL